MPGMIVPPGGHAGFTQMTPASKAAWFQPSRSSGSRRKRSKKARAARSTSSRSSRKRSKGGRKMKFGSPAWQKKYKVGKYAR